MSDPTNFSSVKVSLSRMLIAGMNELLKQHEGDLSPAAFERSIETPTSDSGIEIIQAYSLLETAQYSKATSHFVMEQTKSLPPRVLLQKFSWRFIPTNRHILTPRWKVPS